MRLLNFDGVAVVPGGIVFDKALDEEGFVEVVLCNFAL